MTDLFEEVEEQLRSDRYRTLARKAAPWVIAVAAAALVATLAVWGWKQHNQQITDKASEQYSAALPPSLRQRGRIGCGAGRGAIGSAPLKRRAEILSGVPD